MKRILTYIFAAAALLATSCTANMNLSKGEEGVLRFTAQSSELQTKAAGEDAYKENTITKVEWFFFKDAEGTQLLHHKSTTTNTLSLDTAEDGEYADLRYKSYLYAVANVDLPTAPEGGWTLEALLKVPVKTQFTKTVQDPEDKNSDVEVLDKDHLNFIMDTYDETRTGNKYLMELTPTMIDDVTPITVKLSRLAVKISTKVKIQKEVTTVDSFGNAEKWTPVLSNVDFDIYMVDALKAGYLSGEPVRRATEVGKEGSAITKADYFTYSRNQSAVKKLDDEEDYYVWQSVDPFYTHPQTWKGEDNHEPFIKVIFPWMSDVKGSSEFHYKIVLPAAEDNVFTLKRNCWYQLTATIKVLGGTENDYVAVETTYSVADWADPSWESGSGLSSPVYFLVPKTEFDIYGEETFDIPFYCEDASFSTVKAYFTSIAFKDYSGKETVDMGGAITGEPPSVNSGGAGAAAWSDTSRPYSVTITTDDSGNKVARFTHKMNDIYVLRDIKLVIYKNASKYTEVILHQHPAIEVKKQGAGDVFVNGHFARLSTNPGFGATKNITDADGVTRTYYHSRNGWNTNRISGYDNYQGLYQYGTITDGSNVDETISKNWYTTDITVTAFNESNNTYTVNNVKTRYLIADPRVKASNHYNNWSLDPYLTGEQQRQYGGYTYYEDITDNWTNTSDILICSQTEGDRAKIAPHFLISSALNANSGLTWDQVVKRAATYQEAGYPAGRWRLPTEGEMAFIAARQRDGTLPTLYAEDSPYWAGSGRLLEDAYAENLSFRNRSGNEAHSVRFVYDLWYWGDEPLSTNQYHANGHIEN